MKIYYFVSFFVMCIMPKDKTHYKKYVEYLFEGAIKESGGIRNFNSEDYIIGTKGGIKAKTDDWNQ